MQHGFARELRLPMLLRILVVIALIAGILAVAPPAQGIPTTGEVNFVLNSSSAPEGTAIHSVSVILDVGIGNTLDADFSVDVSVTGSPGTASSPADYTPTTATVTFLAGAAHGATEPADFNIVGDDLDETDETINLELTNPIGTSVIGSTQTTHQVTISDDDTAAVSLIFGPLGVTEGGATDSYTAVLTSQPTANVTVNMSGGTQVTVSPISPFTPSNWDTPQVVTVTAVDDGAIEGNHNATITHTTTSADPLYDDLNNVSDVPVLIYDNDSAGVSIIGSPVAVTEGGASGTYSIVLDSEPAANVTVNINGTPQLSIGAITQFTPLNWDIPKIVTVTAIDDAGVEGTHGAIVTHTTTSADPLFDELVVNNTLVTITDNDFSVRFSTASSSMTEGDGGATPTNVGVVLFTGGQPLASQATVDVVFTAGGTATQNTDFVFGSQTVTFPASSSNGATSNATISITGDTLNEENETIFLDLQNVSLGGSEASPASHTLTINNDDFAAGLNVVDPSPIAEGETNELVFNVILVDPSGQQITVDYSTADGTATAPGDYTTTSGTLIFPIGVTEQEVRVPITPDTLDETNESVLLSLSNASENNIADGDGEGQILDDDNVLPTSSISITDLSGAPAIEFTTGEQVRISVSFVDPGTDDPHNVTVDWGDGTPLDIFAITPVGGRSFELMHSYSSLGFRQISVSIADDVDASLKTGFVSIVEGGLEGSHRLALVSPWQSIWYLYGEAGNHVTSFYYGNPGDFPFMGDWDGDGIETPGLFRQSDGFAYIRNSNTQGPADLSFFFGNPGDIPIAGDFNNDGKDTVSIYRPANQTFYIINELGEDGGSLGAAEIEYVFGDPGDKPFVGDFDGDGIETVGLHRESTGLVYFRNSHTQGNADAQFIFGDPGDGLIAGDWTGDGAFSPALFRPSNTTTYFKHTNTQGNADSEFVPVPNHKTWIPVSGITGF
ncbi:MAG: Calx-beta domain-containing protein [Acidimicrobiia bacterium]